MRRVAAGIALGATILTPGCRSRPESVRSGSTTTDSSGVAIVTTTGLDALPTWRLADEPELSIGSIGGDGPDSFVAMVGAVVLRDGSILVSDGRAGSVRQFDPDGRFRREVVRSGEGPGELRLPRAPTRVAGDTIVILDGTGRMVVLDPELRLVSTGRVRPYRLGSGGATPETMTSTTAGVGILFDFASPSNPSAGVERRQLVYGLVDVGGAAFDSIGVVRGTEGYRLAGGLGLPVPIAARGVVAIGQTAVFLGESDAPTLDVRDLDGRLRRSIRWTAAVDRVTPDDHVRAIAADSAALFELGEMRSVGADRRRELMAAVRSIPIRPAAPYFTGAFPTDDGGVWIQRHPRRWLPRSEYLVADSTGTIVARIEMDARFTPLQIGAGWVLGRWRTEDDVDLVRRYRIVTIQSGKRP